MTILIALTALLSQADEVVDKIVREAREDNRVMRHLDHLTNKIGPRLTSSLNLTRACEWTRDQFSEWGLEARLEEWGAFAVGFDRGPWSAKMVKPEPLDLTIGTSAWSPGTEGPVTGPAILAPKSDEDLKRMKEKLKGAWVVTTSRGADKYRVAYEEAGVAGIIRSERKDLIVMGGRRKIEWEKWPRLVVVKMIASQHKAIVDHLKAKREVVLTIDVENRFRKGPIKLYNVIAELRGTDKPDEMVIIGGHLDSWDGATGTTDNGTGVATTLEAARLLTKVGARPRRTIRFMLWTGEEQGLLGSRAHIRAHTDLLPRISAVLVHDGGTNYVSGINATEAMASVFEEAFRPMMKLNPKLPFTIRKVDGLPRFIGSDHDSYLAAGVPGFFWRQSRTEEKGQKYSNEHHTQHDVYSSAIPEFQMHSATVIAIGAWRLANLEDLVPRKGLVVRRTAGKGKRRRLGVQCDDDLTILSVVGDSAAQAAGLLEGDRILKLAGRKVEGLPRLREEIQGAPKKTTVRIRRAGKELDLPVTFKR